MIKERDFSHLGQFPGTAGNPFDIILHRLERLEALPWPLFGLILALLAALVSFFDPAKGTLLMGFFLVDWGLLVGLPLRGVSYGPPKPSTLILALLRTIFVIFPLPVFLIFQGIGTALVVYGFWIEPQRLTVTRQQLSTPKFKSGHPLRLLHLGDLHVERITARERRLNALVLQLKPDLILFSGDILNLSYLQDARAWQAARQVMSEWQAPMGVFMVSGSPAVDLPEILPELVGGLPATWLQKDRLSLDFEGNAVELIGLSCTHNPAVDGPALESLVPAPPAAFSILLYHSPDLAPVAARLGIDLQLSGHTHGGQVRLPGIGAAFTGSLYGRAFQAGRMKLQGLTLYISRGIGMEGAAAPRVRLLCPPEIILWEIQASDSAGGIYLKEG